MSLIAEPTAPAAPAADPLANPLIDPRSPGPIRAELFGFERLHEHARCLAAVCALAPVKRANSPLLRQFAEDERILVAAHERIVGGVENREDRGLDAEWLLDNFHIVEEVLREVQKDLPSGYDEELPKLAVDPARGYPRIHALALALVAHSDSELDEARIGHYVAGFQEVAPLTIGELWALPTMLRLVVLENLRRLAEQMLWGWDERRRAERWSGDLMARGRAAPGSSAMPVPDLTYPFLVHLLQLLRDNGPTADAALARIEAQLEGRGTDSNEVLRREHRRQAVNQVSVANCVISLRVLAAIDWNDFFERHSQVELALRGDPAGVYPRQDFATRDRYRRIVEEIARGADVDERVLVRRVVELAGAGRDAGAARGHVGYYLIGRGRATIEAEFRPKLEWKSRLVAWARLHPDLTFFGALVALLGILIAAPLVVASEGGASAGLLVALFVVLILPASELAVGIVNQLLTTLMPPRVLPKLDFKDGIPDACSTIVVMPSMLVRLQSAAMLLERLEIHYLANPDPQFRFALLTDFADAPREEMPEDESYIRAALDGVKALNARYCAGGPDRFFVFHRRRIWNPVQGCFMGWERKRGKLSEFNRLARGDRGTSYTWCSADAGELRRIRFVLTLDADTQLPRDSARRLVGTLAHPLNAPRFDRALGRVVEGYGILQPRVSFHLVAATHSRFAALLAASGGIDPYSTASSDAYMDLFGLGSFTGKGIYDLDAFEAATGGTFPENQVLSHDLVEGNYARCGLVSDTELFDDFPARYHAYARREHRWVRGDWQLLPWIGRRVPTADGQGRRPNPLPLLERWKLFDNLRRSLVPPALVVLLVLGWTVLPGSPWSWTSIALAVPAFPIVQVIASTLFGAARSRSLAGLKRWRDSVPATVGQALLSITFLANQARLVVDATARTLLRHFVTRRHMLEWETAASTERRLGTGLSDFVASMWPASALAVGFALVVALAHPSGLVAAAPVLAAWLLSPLVAYWVSRPPPIAEPPLTDAEGRELRRLARLTWRFFETFVGDNDHWLPPDNFQDDPGTKVAHRTSPTNMGLLLLSTLAAHDFGYIASRTLLRRLSRSFDTFDRLEKHWGQFLNWYDTRTLQPLPPAYVSTVDSGNMLGCLIALKHGLREMVEGPMIGPSLGAGLADTVGNLIEALRRRKPPTDPEAAQSARALEADLRNVERGMFETPDDLLGWDEWLARLDRGVVALIGRIRATFGTQGEGPEDLEPWARLLLAQVQDHRAAMAALAPWLAPLRDLEDAARRRSFDETAWPDQASDLRWVSVRDALVAPSSLAAVVERTGSILNDLAELTAVASGETAERLRAIAAAMRESTAADLLEQANALAARAEAMGAAMDFRPLYKPDRYLYAIGCNLVQGRLDNACYDLLASESALTSFLAIARGEAPRRHWFQLGRPFTRAAGRIGLISWGGTMFEYLMPRLLMRGLAGTLVSEACRTAVARQVEYGRQSGIPWGISESAFSARYPDGDYQYQAFGVPGMGLKRGLERDLVVAPYATALATMIRPREALENFRRLAADGGQGAYGFYEAIDYTPERLPKGRRSVVVRTFMAHHQGMSLVALANALLDEPMPRRFHAEPMVRAVELLLQERIPRDAPLIEPSEVVHPGTRESSRSKDSLTSSEGSPLMSRRLTTPHTPAPRTHLLSNARYHVMLTNAGSGSSTCRGLDVTRWREDPTRDCWGQFCYVRDVEGGLVWSSGHQPINLPASEFEAVFAADKVSFRRVDGAIETRCEITVSTEQLAEVRRVTLSNRDDRPRELELTSYAEVVLGRHVDDLAHPAFGKLFLETEWLPGSEALLCRRRPRSHEQRPVWAVHVSAVEGTVVGDVEYETDRARFLGRGRSPADPAALEPGAVLSGTTGPVLDPIFSLRRRVRLEPGESAVVAFTTAVADTREEALTLADQYHQGSAVARAFELAWAQSLIEHRHRSWSPEEIHLFQRLSSHIIYAGSALRAAPAVLATNRLGLSSLWQHGISGDRPIVLVRVAGVSEMALARQLLAAHAFLRLKGLEFDLVLLSEQAASYDEELPQHLRELIRSSDTRELADKPGGVFVLKGSHIPEEDRILLQVAARVVLVGDRGLLDGQLDRVERASSLPGPLATTREPAPWPEAEHPPESGPLAFDNGLGGFAPEGREYRLTVRGRATHDSRRNGRLRSRAGPHLAFPPAPWSNVIANSGFGFLVTEGGAGPTWSGNSQMNRLTPWSNDPVSDPPGEVIYLRDEETGEVWSPTPLPVPSASPTLVRHGQGYTAFERRSHGLEHELLLFVPPDDPVKLLLLKVRNPGEQPRRLSATFYAEWVLGTVRDTTASQVVIELDPETGALLARNAYRAEYAGSVAFADVGLRPSTATADRSEFLGRHGSTAAPAAMRRAGLSGRVGASLDPCAAVHAPFLIGPGEEKEVVFLLGEAAGIDAARDLLRRYREPVAARVAFDEVKARWEATLTAVRVETPDPAFDLLVNRWLPYQVLSCRLWGRSALYQSGGAYGFRDQLQDVMALVYGAPAEARGQILLTASRQFVAGDVQHWWHPPDGRGVRTRISDDFLWLPFVVSHYATTTGDAAILDEVVPYLEAPSLSPGQEDDYGLPAVAAVPGTLYEHCVRALEHGMRFGALGLPLMGTGDWNDGMNRVGAGGKGESVWLAWFLLTTLRRFAPLAGSRGDASRAEACLAQAEALRAAIEANAWDGQWYRRATFDDGTPLGSASNEECKIDSLAQSWAAISGVADPERVRRALASAEGHLVRRDAGLILLLAPPFDRSSLEPGYIKGYVPGIRENGGQYTHAAAWLVQAVAMEGRGGDAMALFNLLNPINHTDGPAALACYKVEPYVVAGDVYGRAPHTGRGGWTWYTGSAGWLYRVAVETLLGFQLAADRLVIDPRIPAEWPRFEIQYRFRSASFRIVVENPDRVERGLRSLTLDGHPLDGTTIPLTDDGRPHEVIAIMGSMSRSPT